MCDPPAAFSAVAAICCGANRTCHCISWGRNNLLAFASCRSVAVCDPSESVNSIFATLPGHDDQVTCVRWIGKGSPASSRSTGVESEEEELLSGSVDKSVVVWSRAADGQYVISARLLGHTAPLTSVAGHTLTVVQGAGAENEATHDTVTLVVSVAGDSTVRFWLRLRSRGVAFICHQTQTLGSGFALDVALGFHSALALPLVACGCEDSKVHLFASSSSAVDACLSSETFSAIYSLIGHEDWVRGLSFAAESCSGDLLLASCSQDSFIRVWRIGSNSRHHDHTSTKEAEEISDGLLKPRLQLFAVSDRIPGAGAVHFAVSVETVLAGHDGWVYGVQWQPPMISLGRQHRTGSGYSGDESSWHQPMRLLSASMDRTMIIWEPEPESGVWMEQMRVGDVGGNTLGLYGCQFSPNGRSIIAHGYQGGLIRWNHNESGAWKSGPAVGGHFGAVLDLAWDPIDSDYLLSVSVDQTARLFAPADRHRPAVGELHASEESKQQQQEEQQRWFEMARPQVHGYDMQCVAPLGRYRFASGADEKVVRVFEAPMNFLDNFSRLCGHNRDVLMRQRVAESSAAGTAIPEGASVPALGLSNKAVYQGEPSPDLYGDRHLVPHDDEQYAEHAFRPLELSEPPTEDNLLQNTLWPETQKLYGHGFEIFALAASPDGTLLASACKATKAEFANILVWDTATWKPLFSLDGHTLTVSQMAFSHSGRRLLSVSRDRTWCVHELTNDGSSKEMRKIASTDKHTALHSRIIWSCAWSHDDACFATASRDKKVILWIDQHSASGDGISPYLPCQDIPDFADAVTAVDFAPFKIAGGNRYLIAAGLENGHVLLLTWNVGSAHQCVELGSSVAHHLAVRRLSFRRRPGRAGEGGVRANDNCIAGNGGRSGMLLQLASCSDDRAVKVYDLQVAL